MDEPCCRIISGERCGDIDDCVDHDTLSLQHVISRPLDPSAGNLNRIIFGDDIHEKPIFNSAMDGGVRHAFNIRL
jgi:hypothetical protein